MLHTCDAAHVRFCTRATTAPGTERPAVLTFTHPTFQFCMPTDTASQGYKDSIEQLFRFGFWLLVGSVVFSLLGMLLLKLFPAAWEIFGPMYDKLVKTPTWTFMAMLAILPVLMYGVSLGWKRMTFFVVWGCFIGGASELVGTTGFATWNGVALPFGAYEYTQWLGPKMFDHVPYFIPPSWFAMALVSLDLARRATGSRWTGVLLGTVFMVLWDVSLDPAMTKGQVPFWSYTVDGFYYGMPLSNWIGWLVVSLIIIVGYEFIGGGLKETNRWAPWLYVVNCAFPLGICLLEGLYIAVLAGGLATALPFAVIYLSGRREPSIKTAQPQQA